MINYLTGFTRNERLLSRQITSSGSERIQSMLKKRDAYVPNSEKTDNTESTDGTGGQKTHNLTDKELKALNEKYDVKNLTADDRKALLKELKDKGAITEKEYSALKYGTVPYSESGSGKPEFKYINAAVDSIAGMGELSDTDWMSNYGKIADFLKDKASGTNSDYVKKTYEEYEKIYSRVNKLFQQIDSAE